MCLAVNYHLDEMNRRPSDCYSREDCSVCVSLSHCYATFNAFPEKSGNFDFAGLFERRFISYAFSLTLKLGREGQRY